MFSPFQQLNDFKCNNPKLLEFIGTCSIGPITAVRGVWFLITLAFLFPVQNLQILKTRIAKLICEGNSIPNEEVKALYDLLSKYNPFQNKNSCLNNEIFKSIVMKFQQIMCIRIQGDEISGKGSNFAERIEEPHNVLIKKASDFLNCNIALCDLARKNIDIFSACSGNVPSKIRMLTLYVKYEDHIPFQKFYTIGIMNDFGEKLQKSTVKAILLEGNISSKAIKYVTSLSSLTGNITLKLLSKNMVSDVSLLFRQPLLLLKIMEAGCVIDPFIRDDKGTSALHHAIQNDNKDLVLQFCSSLLNLPIEITLTNTPPRSTGEFFLRNLQLIATILSEHKSVFEHSRLCGTAPIVFLEQLLKINSFHEANVENLLKTATPTEFIGHESFSVSNTDKKRIRMNVILSTYADYFNYEDSSSFHQNSSASSFLRDFASYASRFQTYDWYYNMLDLRTALLFFDNLFSLKQDLHIGGSSYEKAESAFFHFVFTGHFFQFKKFSLFEKLLPKAERKKLAIDKCCFSHIICLERLNCFEHLQDFNQILATTHVKQQNTDTTTDVEQQNTDKNSEGSIPEPLESLPEIRDVIVFRTVIYYLTVVSELDHTVWSKKVNTKEQVILVIERALQAVGENLNERFTDKVSLGKSLLISTLPIKVRDNLRDIRDQLSHAYDKSAEGRKRVESNTEIFREIINELETIKSRFLQSYFILELIEYEYMFQKGNSHLNEILLVLNQMTEMDHPESDFIVELAKSFSKSIHVLESANYSIRQVICSFRQHYMIHLMNHFDYIVYYLFESQKIRRFHRLDKIQFHFKCSDVLVDYLLKYCSDKSKASAKELPDLMEDVKNTAINYMEGKAPDAVEDEIQQESIRQKIERAKIMFQLVCEDTRAHRKSNPNETSKSRKHSRASFHQKPESSKKSNRSTAKEMRPSILSKIKSFLYSKKDSRMERSNRGSKSDIGPFQSNDITDYPFIETLVNSLKFFYPITLEQQQFILDNVPTKYKDNSEAKISLERSFKSMQDGQKALTDDEIQLQIDKLVQKKLKVTLKKDFTDENLITNNLDTVRSIRDDYGDLCEQFSKNELIDGKNYERYCRNLELTDEAKTLLEKCVKGRRFEAANDAMMKSLRDKITVLENLLLTSDPRIGKTWREVESPSMKQQVFFLIQERYFRDRILQAAVEMLLFDCMNILKRRTDLKRLWIKATNLFSGINLRNILAHGNPLFKQVGLMLDPNDLPSEIICKCLELVDDRKIIDAMCDLLKGTNGTRDTLFDIVAAREAGSEVLCDVITGSGEKWKHYADLLPSTPEMT